MGDQEQQDFHLEVEEVVQETPRDRTIRLRVTTDESAFGFKPGQYVCVWDPTQDNAPKRYFSISGGDPSTGHFQVTIRRGEDSEPLFYGSLVGQALKTQPPAGTFVLDYEPDDQLILIGGGSGITPFRAYVEALSREAEAPQTVIAQSVKDPAQLVFREEFAAWSDSASWLSYEPVVTGEAEAWQGRRGRLDQATIAGWINDPAKTIVCACGPNPFVDAVLEAAQAAGVPVERCRREGW